MIEIRIEDVVGIAGNDYRLVRKLPDGFLLESLGIDGEPEFFSVAEIMQVHTEGLLSIREERDVGEPASEFETDRARFRRFFCESFLALREEGSATLSDRSIGAVIPGIYADWALSELEGRDDEFAPIFGQPPSPGTFRRWLRRDECPHLSMPHHRLAERQAGSRGRIDDGLARSAAR